MALRIGRNAQFNHGSHLTFQVGHLRIESKLQCWPDMT